MLTVIFLKFLETSTVKNSLQELHWERSISVVHIADVIGVLDPHLLIDEFKYLFELGPIEPLILDSE